MIKEESIQRLINSDTLIKYGKNVLNIEISALQKLLSNIDHNFSQACQRIINCQGSVIVTGMGKSGHIAKKMAATFSSTGTPAFFMHPGEAAHGDLGMITPKDLVIALSNSGESPEIIAILTAIKRLGVPLIALTGAPLSQLAKHAEVHIDIGVEKEACSLGLAPTASTTNTLAMGDALAVSILQAKGFTTNDFAFSHPGGKLGKRLLIKVADVMHTGEQIPKVNADSTLPATIVEISAKRLGMTTVIDGGRITGIFTDGDLRRVLGSYENIHDVKVETVMSKKFLTIKADLLAHEAAFIMQKHKITALPVVDEQNNLIGALNIHDLFKAGVI